MAKISALADEDDEVTKEEFMHYAKNSDFFKAQMDKSSANSMAAKEEAIAKAERAFKVFDKDNDGFITKDEFAKISKKLNRDQVNAVFNKFDKDGDGVLSFEEFRRMLNKDKKWRKKISKIPPKNPRYYIQLIWNYLYRGSSHWRKYMYRIRAYNTPLLIKPQVQQNLYKPPLFLPLKSTFWGFLWKKFQ